jgi:hypothetical protein
MCRYVELLSLIETSLAMTGLYVGRLQNDILASILGYGLRLLCATYKNKLFKPGLQEQLLLNFHT